jgi:hypothetical protein
MGHIYILILWHLDIGVKTFIEQIITARGVTLWPDTTKENEEDISPCRLATFDFGLTQDAGYGYALFSDFGFLPELSATTSSSVYKPRHRHPLL